MFATVRHERGGFLLEYSGKLISAEAGYRVEQNAKDLCNLFYFKNGGTTMW